MRALHRLKGTSIMLLSINKRVRDGVEFMRDDRGC